MSVFAFFFSILHDFFLTKDSASLEHHFARYQMANFVFGQTKRLIRSHLVQELNPRWWKGQGWKTVHPWPSSRIVQKLSSSNITVSWTNLKTNSLKFVHQNIIYMVFTCALNKHLEPENDRYFVKTSEISNTLILLATVLLSTKFTVYSLPKIMNTSNII